MEDSALADPEKKTGSERKLSLYLPFYVRVVYESCYIVSSVCYWHAGVGHQSIGSVVCTSLDISLFHPSPWAEKSITLKQSSNSCKEACILSLQLRWIEAVASLKKTEKLELLQFPPFCQFLIPAFAVWKALELRKFCPLLRERRQNCIF